MPELKKGFIKMTDEEYEEELRKRNDPAESKIYVILVYAPEEEAVNYKWYPCVGRSATYDTLKTIVQEYAIDLRKSRVLVTGTTYEDSSSVYAVLKHLANIYNDGFDVDSYDSYPDDGEEDAMPVQNQSIIAQPAPAATGDTTEADLIYGEDEDEGTDI